MKRLASLLAATALLALSASVALAADPTPAASDPGLAPEPIPTFLSELPPVGLGYTPCGDPADPACALVPYVEPVPPIESADEALFAAWNADTRFAGWGPMTGVAGTSHGVEISETADGWLVRFWAGEGDCPAGCIARHFYDFTVARDGAVSLAESGATLTHDPFAPRVMPAPGGPHGAPEVISAPVATAPVAEAPLETASPVPPVWSEHEVRAYQIALVLTVLGTLAGAAIGFLAGRRTA